MRPIPHVRLKYLLPLALCTGIFTVTYIVWTSNYKAMVAPTSFTMEERDQKSITSSKYDSVIHPGFRGGRMRPPVSRKKIPQRLRDERQNEIFGGLRRVRKKHVETEYQTKPPKKMDRELTTEDEDRMRQTFIRHRQLQKDWEKRRLEIFRHLAKRRKATSSPAPPTEKPKGRDLKFTYYHVEQGRKVDNRRRQDELVGVPALNKPQIIELFHRNQGARDSGGRDSLVLKYHTNTRPDLCNGCMDIHIPFEINPYQLCYQNPEKIKALVLVFSVPGHEAIRDAIRKTWGSLSEQNTGRVRVAFLFGDVPDPNEQSLLRSESVRHQDIILGRFVDSFRNLTLKTIMGLSWATQFCAHAEYVFKTDDDMWLNLPKFFELEPTLKLDDKVSGTCYTEPWRPHRDPESKYYVSVHEYPKEEYPLLCTGTAYLMKMSVANDIMRVSPNVPYFHLEDVYIALCRQKLGYGILPLPGCFNYKEQFDACTYRTDVIASHWITPDEMKQAWTTEECNTASDPIKKFLAKKL